MTLNGFVRKFSTAALGALLLTGTLPALALAQNDHNHGAAAAAPATAEQKTKAAALIKAVREATELYQSSDFAESQGYSLQFGCVSGSDFGAMGMHFVKFGLVDDVLDLTQPEIILYEPLPNGKLRITGADYLIPAAAWDAKHPHDPPQLMGQLFHLFDSPNRFGLEPFYTLHVWAWKENPNGAFTNWNPNVSCEAFNGQVR